MRNCRDYEGALEFSESARRWLRVRAGTWHVETVTFNKSYLDMYLRKLNGCFSGSFK